MLNHLKELIFGINGYEKVKIETRFDELENILSKIEIKELNDFDIVEKCLYKLKEQLRIKSSNLNRIIKESNNNLNKKKINGIIESLDFKKIEFLKNAFSLMSDSNSNKNSLDEVEKVEHETIYEPKFENKIENEKKVIDSLLIFEDNKVSILLSNSKIPYLNVKFKNKIDLSLLKNLASLAFENLKIEGTNIIIQKKTALIIGRKLNDNLIELPKIKSNLDETFNKLKSNIKSENDDNEKYLEIEKPLQTIKTKKKEEDSLDSILSGFNNEKSKLTPKPNPKEDKDKPIIEKISNDEKGIKIEKKHNNIKDDIEIIENEKEEKIVDIEIPKDKFEIYRDEQIIAKFKSNSKILGEIEIFFVNKKKINELNEGELSYISIFSKVFATILFETLNAHGTNMIWNYKGNCIRIIPRYQDDNLKINWEPKKSSDDFLEQIKNKLLNEMKKEIGSTSNNKQINNSNKNDNNKSNENENNLDDLKKAKYLLDQLKRIP